MIRLKLISRDMMPLVPGETYRLEDVARFSKFILIKMLELFGESAWGVADIVGSIRRQLRNYNLFYNKYSRLSKEQKKVLTTLSEKPGQVFLARELAKRQEFGVKNHMQREITSLVSAAWLIGGTYKNELAVFVTEEIASLINILPEYIAYLEAEVPADEATAERESSFFDDLIQLTSYILINPIKITNTGNLGKAAVKKIMPRLSRMASQDWEKLISTNYYPLCFKILMRICEYTDCVKIQVDKTIGQIQFLNAKKWDSHLKMTPDKRLRLALLAYLELLKEFPANDPYSYLETVLCDGADERCVRSFLSPLKLLQISDNKDKAVNKYDLNKYDLNKYGEYHDSMFTCWVWEPLFYLGLAERVALYMPTPWRHGKSEPSERHLWRLSPLGIFMAGILKNERKKFPSRPERRYNDSHSDWLVKSLKNDALFADKFDGYFPPAVSRELVIQNDMTFFMPQNSEPALIWLLHVFGEVERTGYVVSGKFTKDSIIKALKAGLGIDKLIHSVKAASKTEPSPTVLRVIGDWSSSYNRAIFADVTVVVCDTPELAAELAANAKLSQKVLGILGPQTVFIRREDEKMVRQWLEKKGRVPLPGVHDGESLAKWVSDYAK